MSLLTNNLVNIAPQISNGGLSFVGQTNSLLNNVSNLISLTPGQSTPSWIPSIINYDPSQSTDVEAHAYPRTIVQIGGANTGGVVSFPVTSWQVTMEQYGRPSECTIETALSSLPFDILRKTSEGFTATSTPLTSSVQPPLQPISAVTGQNPSFVPIKIWAGYLTADQVKNFDSTVGNPGGSTEGMVAVFDGIISDVKGSLKDDSLTIEGTDKSQILMETRINISKVNMTPAQWATYCASLAGLTPVITPGGLSDIPIGYTYGTSGMKTITRRAIRAWDLLVSIARRIGYDTYVIGNNLFFVQPNSADSFPLLNLKWGNNLENFEFDRDILHADDFQVIVMGYLPHAAKATQSVINVLGESVDSTGVPSLISIPSSGQTIQSGVYLGSSSSPFGGTGKMTYVFMDREGKSKADLDNVAQAIAFDIARHQFHVDLYTIGLVEVTSARVRVMVTIPSNTAPGNFGQTSEMFLSGKILYPLSIEHDFNSNSGWTMHITAAYLPPPPISGSSGLPTTLPSPGGFSSWIGGN